MGFFAPWFLIGLAGLGAPLYLHLLRRQTTTPRPFSSLMFFEPRVQSSMRHRRLRYLWLLALRLALLALLVLAFANPYISRPAASQNGDRLTLIVVDHSFSMNQGTRLKDAQSRALALLAGWHSRGQVAALGSRLELLTQPETDAAALRAAILGIQPGDSRADLGELARGLRALAAATPTPITVHLFSDMQRSGMPANFADLALPANVTLVPHAVAPAAVPNWTVESVKSPSEVWGSPKDSKPARVEAVIVGYGTPAASRTVSLVVNGQKVATQTVSVPAATDAPGRATVVFDALQVPYGWSRCAVRLDSPDVFPDDNASVFAVRRADPERVLFVHGAGDTRSPLYFRTALDAAADGNFTVEEASAGAAGAHTDLSGYALVVLSDVPGLPVEFESALLRYVQGGGGVLVALGTASRGVPLFGGSITDSSITDSSIKDTRNYGEQYLTVGASDASYPSTALLGGWDGVRFFYAVNVDPAGARVVARLSDQTPLLLDRKIGEGHVELLASGLDNLTNDFPLHPSFVPFVRETARYLTGDEEAGTGARMVDTFLTLRTAKEQGIGVEVTDPSGRRPLSLDQATTAQALPLAQAGFYQVRLANGREQVVGVNPDRRESDLSVIPAETLALWRGAPAGEPAPSAGAPAPAQAVPSAKQSTPPSTGPAQLQPGREAMLGPAPVKAQPRFGAQGPQAGASISGMRGEATLGPAPVKVGFWWYVMLLLLLAAVAESVAASRYLGVRREEEEMP